MNRGSLDTRSFRRIYTSPFLDTDELKMALRARKVSGAFEIMCFDDVTELERVVLIGEILVSFFFGRFMDRAAVFITIVLFNLLIN